MATLKSPTQIANTVQSGDAADLAQALSVHMDGLLAVGELLQRQPLSKTVGAQVEAMMAAAQRMARMLCDTADLQLTPSPAFEPVCLRQLVDGVEAHWGRSGDTGARVLISCNAPAEFRAMIDPSRLQRLLNTLLEIASDASAGGVIELQLLLGFDPDGAAVLKGRLEASGSADAKGFSPAIALCRTLAQHMGGDLAVTGAAGSGLLVNFDIRAAAAADLAAPTIDADTDDGPLPARTHLLIVDDNATNRIVAAALCEMFGCTSETAEDGLEALEAARSRPFDLILMDIKMPRMDGLEATRAIRALPGPAGETPIVALTANADADAVAVYLAVGMQAVVDKPIKPDQLLTTLQWALGADGETMRRSTAA